MKKIAVVLAALFIAGSAVYAGEEEPWRRKYEGGQATGEQVIALWQFLPGEETRDSSGNGHHLEERGFPALMGRTRFSREGLFGSCLESFGTTREENMQNGARARNHPNLSPEGAFTLELWVRPKRELSDQENRTSLLIDKKYWPRTHSDRPDLNRDYQLHLRRNSGDEKVFNGSIRASLGYGNDSALYESNRIELKIGDWSHVAFTYDGAGNGRFFLNGAPVGGRTHSGRASIEPGGYPVMIGGRNGSRYAGFPGFIDQVRIMNGIPCWFQQD